MQVALYHPSKMFDFDVDKAAVTRNVAINLCQRRADHADILEYLYREKQ